MTRTQKDLLAACRTKGIKQWPAVKAYAERYTKYDNMTYRQIDEVADSLNNH